MHGRITKRGVLSVEQELLYKSDVSKENKMNDVKYVQIDNPTVRDKFETHEMTPDGINVSEDIRFWASMILDCIDDNLKHSRETSLAVTKLEECVMWANKSIALHGVSAIEVVMRHNEH